MSDCQGTAVCGAGQGAAGIKIPDTVSDRYGIRYFFIVLRQYRTKIVRQMRRQIFRQMKQKAE